METAKKEVIVVDAETYLRNGTMPDGWTLQRVIYVERLETPSPSTRPPKKLSTALLVLERSFDDRERALRSEIEETRSESIEARNENYALKKSLSDAESKVKTAEAARAKTVLESEALVKQIAELRGQIYSSQTSNRKFEKDLAKIRTAIGSQKMAEILGSEPHET